MPNNDIVLPRPTRWDIQTLRNSSVQPWADIVGEEREGLRRSLVATKKRLIDPVKVSSDHILLDGNQRLALLAELGRKTIDDDEVFVIAEANRENALDYAIRLNVEKGRRLTKDQKIEKAVELRKQRWSQRRIAQAMLVTQAAVSQWLAQANEPPIEVTGLDGKVYSPPPRRERKERAEQRNPWKPDGYAFKVLRQTHKYLQTNPLGGLNAIETERLRAELGNVIEAALVMQAALDAPKPDEDT